VIVAQLVKGKFGYVSCPYISDATQIERELFGNEESDVHHVSNVATAKNILFLVNYVASSNPQPTFFPTSYPTKIEKYFGTYHYPAGLVKAVSVISWLVGSMIVVILIIFFIYQRSLLIKSSSPVFMLLMLTGATLLCYAATLYAILPTNENNICRLRVW
jgi:hypothetical protein